MCSFATTAAARPAILRLKQLKKDALCTHESFCKTDQSRVINSNPARHSSYQEERERERQRKPRQKLAIIQEEAGRVFLGSLGKDAVVAEAMEERE